MGEDQDLGSSGPLTLSEDFLELPGTYEGVVRLLGRVLLHPHIQEINVRVDAPVRVVWFRRQHDAYLIDPTAGPTRASELLREAPIVDYRGWGGFLSELMGASIGHSARGLYPVVVLCGSIRLVKAHSNVPAETDLWEVDEHGTHLFGGFKLVESDELGETDVVLFSTDKESATVEEALARRATLGARILL